MKKVLTEGEKWEKPGSPFSRLSVVLLRIFCLEFDAVVTVSWKLFLEGKPDTPSKVRRNNVAEFFNEGMNVVL